MGITRLSLDRINKYLQPNSTMLIIGCQNLYNEENYGEVANDYFCNLGHRSIHIDICNCNGASIVDLREDHPINPVNDLILQHGTIEHIDGSIYQSLRTFHNGCKMGGLMVHENPQTKSWPGHGQHYFTQDFWRELAKMCEYGVLELGEEPAMGNTTDGWNVYCVLRKTNDREFITEKQFEKLYKSYIKNK